MISGGQDEDDLDRHAFDYSRFWRYRVPITATHLKYSLQEFIVKSVAKSVCAILQAFLEKVFIFGSLIPLEGNGLDASYLITFRVFFGFWKTLHSSSWNDLRL